MITRRRKEAEWRRRRSSEGGSARVRAVP